MFCLSSILSFGSNSSDNDDLEQTISMKRTIQSRMMCQKNVVDVKISSMGHFVTISEIEEGNVSPIFRGTQTYWNNTQRDNILELRCNVIKQAQELHPFKYLIF